MEEPAGELFDTLQAAYDACQRMALGRHFAITRGRTTRSKGANRKYDPKGRVMRQDITCTRGSTNTAAVRSNGRSTKTACPWRAKIVHVKAMDRYRLTIQNDTHNHEIDATDDWSPANIAAVRRWQRNSQPAIIAEIHRLAASGNLSCTKIAAQISENSALAGPHGPVLINAADVANEIRQHRIALANRPQGEDPEANAAQQQPGAAEAAAGSADDIPALNRRIDGIENTLAQLMSLVQQVAARLPPAPPPPAPPLLPQSHSHSHPAAGVANATASHLHDHSAVSNNGNHTMGMGFQ
ncbi:hypothetical protein B0T11DRAFT_11762 [Plectosphaerella cucumerina]|jgi:hypothetical protein|uniref:FAR1 domain-containing protein n=1 Tax=Plectosphaerella cucumerina TaxID=40658 RepID=A0A8K0TS54_9PEZI|nr:hypothetical protein B0T11DRAFT_11762 [Plectosphaerella cucumerina]